MRLALLLLPLLLAPPGCATIVSTVAPDPSGSQPLLFSGTRLDTAAVLALEGPLPTGYRVLAAFDLPLSLVLDAGFSPLTLVQSAVVWAGGGHEPLVTPPPAPPQGLADDPVRQGPTVPQARSPSVRPARR